MPVYLEYPWSNLGYTVGPHTESSVNNPYEQIPYYKSEKDIPSLEYPFWLVKQDNWGKSYAGFCGLLCTLAKPTHNPTIHTILVGYTPHASNQHQIHVVYPIPEVFIDNSTIFPASGHHIRIWDNTGTGANPGYPIKKTTNLWDLSPIADWYKIDKSQFREIIPSSPFAKNSNFFKLTVNI